VLSEVLLSDFLFSTNPKNTGMGLKSDLVGNMNDVELYANASYSSFQGTVTLAQFQATVCFYSFI
jgi:hypothetical protein